MALTEIDVSSNELARVAAEAYHGKQIRVSLANDPTSTLAIDGTTASYDALKISDTGYSDYTATIAVGAYDSVDGRFEIGETNGANTYILAEFGPFPNGATYDTIYYVIDSSANIYGRTVIGTTVIPPGGAAIPYPFQIGIG